MYITDTTFSQAHNLNRASRPSAGTDELREKRTATAAPVFQDAEFGHDSREELS
jgi:hypothetical protein